MSVAGKLDDVSSLVFLLVNFETMKPNKKGGPAFFCGEGKEKNQAIDDDVTLLRHMHHSEIQHFLIFIIKCYYKTRITKKKHSLTHE